jgi:hypothetical protein
MKKTTFLAVFVLCFFAGANAWDYTSALDLSGQVTYPTQVSNETTELDKKISGSASIGASLLVNNDFLPQLWFAPVLSVNYSNTAQPLNIEDDRFLFSQWLDTYISYGFNYEVFDGWELRLKGFTRKSIAQQAANEPFGKGLYDYIENGIYIEDANVFEADGMPVELTAGFKYTDRRFPNYTILLTQIDPDELGYETPNTYTKEKDSISYSGYANAMLKLGDSNWYAVAGFTYDYTPYLEQKVIDFDGMFTAAKRADKQSVVEISFPYYPTKTSGASIGYVLTNNYSSQNYYDSLGNMDPADDVFTRGYYDYTDHAIQLALTYELQFSLLSEIKPAITVGFNMNFTNYASRYAKAQAGNYTDALQKDNIYVIYADFRQKYTEFWEVFLNVNYSRFYSNMKWEAYGAYNYSFLMLSAGSALSF